MCKLYSASLNAGTAYQRMTRHTSDTPVSIRTIATRLPKGRGKADLLALAIAAIVAVPILAVLAALFTSDVALWQRLWATTLPRYIFNSVALMGLTGLLACLIGVSTAWCVSMLEFPGRRILSWLLILPLAAPAYIVAYVYVDLLDFFGPVQSAMRAVFGWEFGDYKFPQIRTLPGAAFILAIVLYPYVYLLSRAIFLRQSSAQWQVARSLGLGPHQAFWRVALPAARPAIIGGLALVLMETLADFGVADYFGIPTFSTGIFRNWLAGGNKPAAMSLAAIMLLAVIALTALEASSRSGAVQTQGKTMQEAGRMQLGRKTAAAVVMLCVLPVILGFIIPFARLLYNTLTQIDPQTRATFLSYAINSVLLACIVAFIATALALYLGYCQRAQPARLTRAAIRLSTLGYALPGALLAVGLLAPLGGFDRALTRWASEALGWEGGLILSGTLIVLIYALVVRFLTVSFNAISSGFEKIPPSMDAAARSLGRGPLGVVRDIHAPLLRPSLVAGAILVFVDVLRELPATLILRPFNFDTLATRVYWLASDERLAEASSAALLIVIFGLIPIILLNRVLEGRDAE